MLDFANLDYSLSEKLGFRVGRNKLPQGLYGEVQDLDQVRTFASLPLNFYPRALRSLSAGYNGASAYGTLNLKGAGSLEYQAAYGIMDNVNADAPYALGLASLTKTDHLDLNGVYIGSLVWSAPVDGLRFGYTYSFSTDAHIDSRIQTRADMVLANQSLAVPNSIDGAYGAGTWDRSGLFAGTSSRTDVDVSTQVASVEYTRGNFVGTAEYKVMRSSGFSTLPALGQIRTPFVSGEHHWYVQGTYQVTDPVSVGLYFCSSDFDPYNKSTAAKKYIRQKDYAASVSYAVQPYWLVKAEVHMMDGIGGLAKAGDINVGANDGGWSYYVVKTTFSF